MTQFRPDRRGAMAWTLAAALVASLPTTAWPAGPPRLTVICPEGERSYGLADLRSMGETTMTTSTPWTDRADEFTGVSLARILGDSATADGTLRLIALNDYEIRMPVSAVGRDVPIIAYWRNGAPMSIRDKGPFWVMFPFDSDAQYHAETIYSRSVWQLVRIEIEP